MAIGSIATGAEELCQLTADRKGFEMYACRFTMINDAYSHQAL
ncbi:hypothetical protein [Lacticaseibacillus paracasei]|nr:hypothetical protein [Lacticaseibacillus paracasei]MCU6431536.1 hypothetical protein [Lacticaseibacillus paracasei]